VTGKRGRRRVPPGIANWRKTGVVKLGKQSDVRGGNGLSKRRGLR